MWLGDALTFDAGAPTAGASGEPFDAATGCLFVLFVAAKTTTATNSPEASRSASRTCPPLTSLILTGSYEIFKEISLAAPRGLAAADGELDREVPTLDRAGPR
jgi:hypothetical protein